MALDLSIKHLEKVFNSETKRQAFLESVVKVTEKFDGTKLTLVRNSEPFDPGDYRKNWIVAYKGNVISSSEFDGLNQRINDDVQRRSIGTSQYGLVHQHLKMVHPECSAIPCNTEFFIEFIQRKPTLTRDYDCFHGLFFIASAKVDAIFVDDMHVFTTNSDEKLTEDYSRFLKLSYPPVKHADAAKNITTEGTFDSIVKKYENFESILGGQAEGVVIEMPDGKLYKVVAKDQYDKATRAAKKARWSMTQEKETEYWRLMNEQAQDIINSIDASNLDSFLSQLSSRVYGLKKDDIRAQNRKKDLIIHQDDLFLTAKLRYDRTNKIPAGVKTVGVFVMAGKPVHNGHWKMIQKMSQENDVGILYVSLGDRSTDDVNVSSKMMAGIWQSFLKERLPQNIILRFSENPTLDCIHHVQALQDDFVKGGKRVILYSDVVDAANWDNNLRKNFPILYSFGKVSICRVNREDTDLISGTKMRWMLKMGDEGGHKYQFMMHLPACLSKDEKAQVWERLREQLT